MRMCDFLSYIYVFLHRPSWKKCWHMSLVWQWLASIISWYGHVDTLELDGLVIAEPELHVIHYMEACLGMHLYWQWNKRNESMPASTVCWFLNLVRNPARKYAEFVIWYQSLTYGMTDEKHSSDSDRELAYRMQRMMSWHKQVPPWECSEWRAGLPLRYWKSLRHEVTSQYFPFDSKRQSSSMVQ